MSARPQIMFVPMGLLANTGLKVATKKTIGRPKASIQFRNFWRVRDEHPFLLTICIHPGGGRKADFSTALLTMRA
jgi:hypothetical protein